MIYNIAIGGIRYVFSRHSWAFSSSLITLSEVYTKLQVRIFFHSEKQMVSKSTKPSYRKETERCSVFFLYPMTIRLLLASSSQRPRPLTWGWTSAAVIQCLKADWMWNYINNSTMAHVFWNRVHNDFSRPSKVVDFGTNRNRVLDFLSVFNSYLGHILPRFRDIRAFYAESHFFHTLSPYSGQNFRVFP